MKKIVVVLSIVTLIAVIAVVALVFYTMGLRNQQPQNTTPTTDVQSNNQNQDEVSAELAAELAELQELLDSILADNHGQGDAEMITDREAMDIALQYIGHGSVNDVLLFSDEGVLTFEVDIRHEEVRYMVYINALSGSVISSDSFDEQQD